MRLNEESIKKLRTQLEIELTKVDEDHSVVLPLELLERLIFSKTTITRKETVLYPVWCGPFLRKLDLSKLSFDGVCLDYEMILNVRLATEIEEQVQKEIAENERKSKEERLRRNMSFSEEDDSQKKSSSYISLEARRSIIAKQIMEKIPRLDFSGTNIKIDFSKLARASISKINLSGVDLRCSNSAALMGINDCDISNTRIILPFGNPRFTIKDSNFTQNDFSYLQIDESVFYRATNLRNPSVVNCDFSGTGLSLVYSMSKKQIDKIIDEKHTEALENQKRAKFNSNSPFFSSEPQKMIVEYDRLGCEIKAGHFAGCIINGKLMPTKEQCQANKERNQAVVANFEQEEMGKILSLVRKQIKPEETI